jgi:hypothetical protein
MNSPGGIATTGDGSRMSTQRGNQGDERKKRLDVPSAIVVVMPPQAKILQKRNHDGFASGAVSIDRELD